MEFVITKKGFLPILQTAIKVVPERPVLPILSCFLIELSKDALRITASNMETSVVYSITSDFSCTGEGRLAVDAKELLNLVKELPEGDIVFSLTGPTLKVTWGSGKSCMPVLEAGDYPNVSVSFKGDCTEAIVSAEHLSELISKTIFASEENTVRPVLGALCFDFQSGLTIAASDTKKLVLYSLEKVQATEGATNILLPKSSAIILKDILHKKVDDVKINYNNSSVSFSQPGITFISRSIEGSFPNFRKVIPSDEPNVLVIDRETLLSAVKRVSVCKAGNTFALKMSLSCNTLTLETSNLAKGIANDETFTMVDYAGEDIQIGFNALPLIEVLSNFPAKTLRFVIRNGKSPANIKCADEKKNGMDYQAILMPMAI